MDILGIVLGFLLMTFGTIYDAKNVVHVVVFKVFPFFSGVVAALEALHNLGWILA